MAILKKKEILVELNKLGINSTAERNDYYREYKKYSSTHSQQFLRRTGEWIRSQLLPIMNVHSLLFSLRTLVQINKRNS